MTPTSVSLREIEDQVGKRVSVEALIYQAVIAARLEGATWQEIADVLGVTRQAAWERFRRVCQ